jgi:signal transduction histidine kinase
MVRAGGTLPPLRIAIEAVTVALAAAGLALHVLRYRRSGDWLFMRMAMALGLLALGEAADALSASPADALGLCAHLYAAVAGWLVYDALFAAAVLDPYVRLETATRELRASNAHLELLRGRIEGELAETIGRLAETTEREVKSRAELEAAIAATPEAILVYSPQGRILRQNELARRLFLAAQDLREDSVLSRWKALKPRTTDGRPVPLEEDPLARALRGETVRGCVLAIHPPGRKATWVSVSAAPIRAEDVLVGAVAAVADVSALQDLQSQLEDLLRSVSHDLRNPLQIVLLQGERLLRLANADGSEKVRHAATAVIAASRQMGSLIRDLVDAARMESGRQRLACQPLDLGTWLPGLLSLSAGAIDPARVRLDLPRDLPLAWADPARLDRVVLNLLGNALRHSPAGAEVLVSAAVRGDQVAVAVHDRGGGIAPEDLPHLFERFYRGKASVGDGLGLGLYIVRLLVEAHGGRIRAESGPGAGSTFTFTLPLALPPAGADAGA